MPPEQAGLAQVHVRGIDNLTARKRTAEAIRASEKRYREFFERNLSGTFRSMPDGRLLECNDSLVRMLGYASQEELLGHSVWELYFQPADREAALRRLLDQKVVMNEEFQLRRKDGSSVWILANRMLNETEHPPVIEGTVMDISRQKGAEADIHSLLKISKTLNSTRDIDALLDAVIMEAVKMTGAECGWSGMRTPEGVACHKYLQDSRFTPFEYCWPPGSGWPGWVLAHKVPYVTNDALEDGVIVPKIREQFGIRSGINTPILDGRGEVIAFLEVNNKRGESGFTEFDVEKMVAISQVASVALQNALAYQKIQRNEEELRQLSARLLRLQDDERRRLARELHDATGQILATLALKIGAARRSLGADNQKVLDSLSESSALVKQCSDDLRTLSYLLHPPLIDEEGLASALRWYAQGFAKRSGIRIELDLSSELGRLPQDVETTLFRTVQEALTNVHLHSGSPVAWIRVAHTPSEIALEIRDQGRGIPPEVLKALPTGVSNLGVGIAGMRERVRQLGGRVEIDSGNWGTKVRAVVSLHEGSS